MVELCLLSGIGLDNLVGVVREGPEVEAAGSGVSDNYMITYWVSDVFEWPDEHDGCWEQKRPSAGKPVAERTVTTGYC